MLECWMNDFFLLLRARVLAFRMRPLFGVPFFFDPRGAVAGAAAAVGNNGALFEWWEIDATTIRMKEAIEKRIVGLVLQVLVPEFMIIVEVTIWNGNEILAVQYSNVRSNVFFLWDNWAGHTSIVIHHDQDVACWRHQVIRSQGKIFLVSIVIHHDQDVACCRHQVIRSQAKIFLVLCMMLLPSIASLLRRRR